MKKIVLFSSVVLALTSCSKQEASIDNNPVLTIEGGQVQGVELENSVVYRGIPYAAAPVGELRWQRPQPVQAWDTIMVAYAGRYSLHGRFGS